MKRFYGILFSLVICLYATAEIQNTEANDSIQAVLVSTIDTEPPAECSLPIDTVTPKPAKRGKWYDLDSIATWGKFPKFCIDVYRWGDRTFNSYNSAYVIGTGKRWNVKLRNNNWLDYYAFDLSSGDDQDIRMMSDLCSTLGVSLSYMAVSIGYDINITKLLNGTQGIRKKWDFQFCCSLIALDAHFSQNTGSTRITRLGKRKRVSIDFSGIDNKSYGLEAYYFFNNKKYSQAAAYNYSKLQLRNAGSFFAGISLNIYNVDFDFSELPESDFSILPTEWKKNPLFKVNTTSYSLIGGYGYNLVIGKHWIYNITIAPTLGVRHGYNETLDRSRTALGLGGIAKTAFTFNSGNFFASLYGKWDASILSEKENTFINSIGTFNIIGGFRF